MVMRADSGVTVAKKSSVNKATAPTAPLNPGPHGTGLGGILSGQAAGGNGTAANLLNAYGGGAPAAPTGSGGGGGGGGGGGAAPAAIAAPAPVPVRDVDWFNQDAVYRGSAGRALQDLTASLAQIMASRDNNYAQLAQNRTQLGQAKQQDMSDLAADFAGRGLLSSGLYAQGSDQLGQDYANQGAALDQTQNQLAQQYGNQGANVDLSHVDSGNGLNNLSSLYSLLGSLGLQAGSTYNNAIGQAKAASVGRATAPLVQTTNWG